MICAVNQDAEEAFKKTVEVDRLIDKLRDANPSEVSLQCASRSTYKVTKVVLTECK